MIVQLKMHTTGKSVSKICLRAIRDTYFFLQHVVCDQGRDRGTQIFGEGNIQQKGKVQIFGLAGRPPLSPDSLS